MAHRSAMLAAWTAILLMQGLLSAASGQTPSTPQPSAEMLQSQILPQLGLAGPHVPLPHELHPNDWPQPDYFTVALQLTRFQAEGRYRALKLRGNIEPELLVLPVQMEAFGWTPAFTAVVGARLDHELATRGWNANRQTDLFSANGPYVRRFSDAEISAFASVHPKARVLALYLGRDGAGKDFVTLTLRDGGQTAVVHRSVDEAASPVAALYSIAATLPALLNEIGLAPKTGAGSEASPHCRAESWDLADSDASHDRAQRACRALIMGTLLPEFEEAGKLYPGAETPDKLAWLAEAFVEADALEAKSAAAARSVAWGQLDLADGYDAVGAAVDVDDPVVQPLARLLWANWRTYSMPVKSPDAETEAYAAAASDKLPTFARDVFTERANFAPQFRSVDICALELQIPSFRVPQECADVEAPPLRKQPATRMEVALLDAWRLAWAYKALAIEGRSRGDLSGRQELLNSLPTELAAHPFIRRLRFQTEPLNAATGSFASVLDHARTAVGDYVQTTADLQRLDIVLEEKPVSFGLWTQNTALRDDAHIAADSNDERRLLGVLEYDGFSNRRRQPLKFGEGLLWEFARSGPLLEAATPVASAPPAFSPPFASPLRPAQMAASAAPHSPFMHAPHPPLFLPPLPPQVQSVAMLEQALAADPNDMEIRVDLALARLKAGQSLAQARALIDARPADQRINYAISESHNWSRPAHALFFAAELGAAKAYYERVQSIGTGSEADLHAQIRLRQIDGDISGALAATRGRLDRYESDFARRDLAGFAFMLDRPELAWQALQPRLPLSQELELWVAVKAGQRREGKSARQVQDWINHSDDDHARLLGLNIGTVYLGRFVSDDRIPSDDDIAILSELGQQAPASGAVIEASLRLKQLAFADAVDTDSLQAVKAQMTRSDWTLRNNLKPLYAWVAWHASRGTDPDLAGLRGATLQGDFDALLAKGVLLGLDQQPDAALSFLRAARFELAQLSARRLPEEIRSAPYTLALMDELLYRETKNGGYRAEALTLARSYQRIFPFEAWPYALDVLLSPDDASRGLTRCRAQYLDRDSLFLKLSGIQPKTANAACKKPLWDAHSWRSTSSTARISGQAKPSR